MLTVQKYLPQSLLDLAQWACGTDTQPLIGQAMPEWFIRHRHAGERLAREAASEPALAQSRADRRPAADLARGDHLPAMPATEADAARLFSECVERRTGLVVDFTSGETAGSARPEIRLGSERLYRCFRDLRAGMTDATVMLDPQAPDLNVSQVKLRRSVRASGATAFHEQAREATLLEVISLLDGRLWSPGAALAAARHCANFREAQRTRPDGERETVTVLCHDRRLARQLAGAERLYARWEAGGLTPRSCEAEVLSILRDLPATPGATTPSGLAPDEDLATTLLALAGLLLDTPAAAAAQTP